MPDCSEDYVEVFIGCGGHSIGKYCCHDGSVPFDMYSTDKCLRIVFHSDHSGAGRGFEASYTSLDLSQGIKQRFSQLFMSTT